MGRRIYCEGEFVYKYCFGEQDSELYKLAEHFGIGKHNMDDTNPEFVMEWEDVNKLRDLMNETIVLPNGRQATRNQMLRNFRRAEKRVFGSKGMASFDDMGRFYKIRAQKNYDEALFWDMAKAVYATARKEYFKGNHTIVFQDEW